MQTKHSHIIEKELIEITLPDFAAVRNWEDKYRQPFVEDVREVIDRTFSEYEKINGYLVLDKVQIDLGVLKVEDLHKEMSARLYLELQKALRPYLTGSAIANATGSGQQWNNETEFKEGYRLLSDSARKLESLLYFLESGRLPWWASDLGGWDREWFQHLSPVEWKTIREYFIAKDHDVVFRLISQVNDECLAELVKGLGGTEEIIDGWNWFSALVKALKEFIDELIERNLAPTAITEQINLKRKLSAIQLLRQRYWSQWIHYLLEKNSLPSLNFLFGEDWNLIFHMQQLILTKDQVAEFLNSNKTPSFWSDELTVYQQQAKLTFEQLVQAQKSKEDSKSFELVPFTSIESASLQEKRQTSRKKIQTDEASEDIFITSAGLVLLHPFLPQMFRHFGLLEEKQFADSYAQTRAVYLLNYLVTGETRSPEYNLLLPKLLVGMAWEERLEPVEPINESEKADCEEMLVEVIRHWTALRNSSAAGLREAFLQRNGRIEIRNDGWQLIVEEKAQDVLIGRLPWGFSIIKYPWMTGILSVVWR